MIDFSMWHSPVLLHDWFLHVTQSSLITWLISPYDTVQSYYMIYFSMWHSPVLLHDLFLHVTQSSLITWLISPCDTVQSYYKIDFSMWHSPVLLHDWFLHVTQSSLITWLISRYNWASSHDLFLDTIEPHRMIDFSDTIGSHHMIDFSIQLSLITWLMSPCDIQCHEKLGVFILMAQPQTVTCVSSSANAQELLQSSVETSHVWSEMSSRSRYLTWYDFSIIFCTNWLERTWFWWHNPAKFWFWVYGAFPTWKYTI